VLPALAAAVALLDQQDRAEADNFRTTVLVALEAAAATSRNGRPGPVVNEMTRKVAAALHAA
jgi:hypothetical protein